MQQNSLQNICNYSFPGNHLLNFSLVRQQQEQSYKKEYFFFITCAPGEKNQNGNRTFNFQNKFVMKMDIDKIFMLRHAIICYATGREAMIGQFSIFADSSKSNFNQGGGTKTIFLNKNNDQRGNPVLSLTFKLGQNKGIAYSMPIATALAISDVLKIMADKGLKLELERSTFNIQPTSIKERVDNSSSPDPNFNQQNNNSVPAPDPNFQTNNTSVPDPNFNQQNNNQSNTPQNVADNFADTLGNMGGNFGDDIPF